MSIVTLLIGAGCGSNADNDDDSAASPTEDPTGATTDTLSGAQDPGVPEALRFRAPLVGGGEIDMSALAGKPVVLWFWAPY